MLRNPRVDRELKTFIQHNKPRAGSFIITLFGDVISQHGNCVWLGSIIDALACFDLNARQIRTAVSRLAQENWLQSVQLGRKSFYSLTGFGQSQYRRAARRIYANDLSSWDGQWTLVLLAQVDSTLREQVRRELTWLGFGQINFGSFVHPRVDRKVLSALITELKIENQLMIMRASTDELTSQETVGNISYQAWRLDEMEPRYEAFCRLFEHSLEQIQSATEHDDQQMFELRLIMIHEYRRLLLKTTELPSALLPDKWPGAKAMEIASALYKATTQGSLNFISQSFQSKSGLLAPVENDFHQRFSSMN